MAEAEGSRGDVFSRTRLWQSLHCCAKDYSGLAFEAVREPLMLLARDFRNINLEVETCDLVEEKSMVGYQRSGLKRDRYERSYH